jgi:hypothetical protein
MTATCSSVVVVKHDLYLFIGETSTKDAIYTSMIQCVFDNKIKKILMAYTSTLVTRSRSRTLQILKID